ncbi:hypothetical protein NXS19_008433 [Fusarium pseudograminearum]|nr:hypothetical protein NXS19_008433 [Fusarium pseudograminearum]
MASIMEKIKETVVPSNNEGYNTNPSSHDHEPPATASPPTPTTITLASTTLTQNEGVRTGDRINSLVENVPGVSSSSTQNKSTFDTPSYQNNTHHDTSSDTPIDAARAPPSVFKEHLGEPTIEHDYPHESSTKRHASVSHQEEHYNLN